MAGGGGTWRVARGNGQGGWAGGGAHPRELPSYGDMTWVRLASSHSRRKHSPEACHSLSLVPRRLRLPATAVCDGRAAARGAPYMRPQRGVATRDAPLAAAAVALPSPSRASQPATVAPPGPGRAVGLTAARPAGSERAMPPRLRARPRRRARGWCAQWGSRRPPLRWLETLSSRADSHASLTL